MTHVVREIPDLFHFWESQIVQDVVENSYVDTVNPSSGFDGRYSGDIKFEIDGTDSFVDMSKSFIYFKLRLTGAGKKASGSEPAVSTKFSDFKDTKLTVVNSIVHSLFKSIEVRLGGQLITLGDSDYGYRSYIQLLCNTTKEAQDTYFHVIGWKKDEAGKMDDLANNKAFEYRRDRCFTHDDGYGEFIMRPHVGLCFMRKVIPPYVSIGLKFTRHNNPHFYMMGETTNITSNWNIEIVEAKYHIQRYKATTSFVSQVEMMLKDHPIIYKIKDSHVHTCTIPNSVSNYSNESLFRGTPPSRIIIAFVATDNYNGALNKNPFSFHHFKVESMRLLKNGLDYPNPPIETNFKTAPNTFVQAYNRVMMSMGADYNDHVLSIEPNEYANGYFFYSYYMAPDQEAGSELNIHGTRPAQIKIEVRFSETLQTSVQMIVYSESDTVVSIDMARRILVTHK